MHTLLIRSIALSAVLALLMVSAGCASRDKSPEQEQDEAFADIKAEIRATVDDPARADEAIELVTEMEQSFDQGRLNIQQGKTNIRVINADYDSERADFDREFGAIRGEINRVNMDFLRIGSQLQTVLTDDERKELNKVRNKYLESAVRSLRAL